MPQLSNQRTAYFNGRYVPESQVVIPFRDRSVKNGDSAYDTTRTFSGRPFKLKEHIERLYNSLNYVRIDPGLSPAEMIAVSEEVVKRNAHLLPADGDWWINQRITRGLDAVGDEGWEHTGPSVIVDCLPLPLKARAPFFRDGIDLQVSPLRRTSPSSLSPRAKMGNKLNLIMADMAVTDINPGVWSLVLDENGNVAEGKGSNFFLVRHGKLTTPREHFVLPGVSRQTVIELAGQLGIPCEETDIDLFDAANGEEAFMTGSSFCLCPVRSLNGQKIGGGRLPGPITQRLTEAYIELVGLDFVKQSMAMLTRD
jgi:branched-chain amino acid aminotransferase